MAIQVLDQNTINKIAAGEVIERPASIVKELVENAIDAKATAITVEIKDGGISFVRITDNGCGIPKDELHLAFLRHSTSKIRSIEDLAAVSSLGFRGEALSSIAAVAQVELITKTKDSFSGSRYVIEGGEEKLREDVGAPDGTTFIVRNLFYNTPVRRKFLKTATTEAGYISALIEHLALSHPDISFRFISNNQNKLHTSGNANLKDIIYHVYGRDISSNLIEIKSRTQDVEIEGFVGKPVISRGNRNYENYYINGRYIKSSVISRAIEEAYKGYIMMHRYPFTAMHFKINPEIIDVNVHPTKMELRFSHNEFVYNFVLEAVRNAITKRELIPDAGFGKPEETVKIKPEVPRFVAEPVKKPLPECPYEPVKEKTIPDAVIVRPNNSQPYKPQLTRPQQTASQPQEVITQPVVSPVEKVPYKEAVTDVKEPVKTETNLNTRLPEPFEVNRSKAMLVEEQSVNYGATTEQLNLFGETGLLDKNNRNRVKIIGQLFDTYWIIEFEEKMFIMDQHAAHEKILFEKTMKLLKDKKIDTQMVSPPMILSLNMREEEVLKQHIKIFSSLGFEIEEFGGREYKVMGVPSNLPGIDSAGLLIEILDSLVDENHGRDTDMITEKVASMSCKAAVKGNNRLSVMEAKALIDELLEAENPYSCPHGRPTLISMSRYEIEKKFKRII